MATASSDRVRRPQARGRATRARLLAAAEDLFARQGYDGTSIGHVAKAAGVGVGTVYHHFSDKRALLFELIDLWADRLAAEPEIAAAERFLGDDPREVFSAWLRSAYRRLQEKPSLYVVALALAGRDPEVGERYQRIEALQIDRLERLIERGQQKGRMRPELDTRAAAFLVQHALDGAATQLLIRRVPHPSPERVMDALAQMVCNYLLT